MRSSIKSVFIFLVLFLSAILLSSCGFNEKTSLKIITPTKGERLTSDTPATNVTVLLTSNRTDITTLAARLMINNTVQGDQILNLNQENTFQIPLSNKGVQKIKLEVTQIDGKKVSAETSFVWIPLEGFDIAALSLAQMVNSEDPTTGYFIIGAILLVIMIILFVATLIKNKGGGVLTGIIAICGFLTLIILAVAGVDPTLAYQYFFEVTSTVGGLAGFAIFAYIVTNLANKNYAFRGGNSVSVKAKTWWPTGQPLAQIDMDAKEGVFFGDSSHIPQTQIAAIAGSLFVLPKIVEQAAFLMEQCPNPRARDEVIDALYTGRENNTMHYLTSGMASGQLMPDGTKVTEPIVTTSSTPGLLGQLFGGFISGFKNKLKANKKG